MNNPSLARGEAPLPHASHVGTWKFCGSQQNTLYYHPQSIPPECRAPTPTELHSPHKAQSLVECLLLRLRHEVNEAGKETNQGTDTSLGPAPCTMRPFPENGLRASLTFIRDKEMCGVLRSFVHLKSKSAVFTPLSLKLIPYRPVLFSSTQGSATQSPKSALQASSAFPSLPQHSPLAWAGGSCTPPPSERRPCGLSSPDLPGLAGSTSEGLNGL